MRKVLVISLVFLVATNADARGRRGRRTGPAFAPAFTPAQSGPVAPVGEAKDALDEVNATRKANGLPPFTRDDGLTTAALQCSAYRASRGIEGHVNDFSFVPAGSSASAAGCAAWPQGMGWGSCCTYENWRHAGAAYCVGSDGRRYMHLFVR